MGINYGHRRPRLEQLRLPNKIIGYSLSDRFVQFEHFDTHQVADLVNDQLDRAERIIKEKL